MNPNEIRRVSTPTEIANATGAGKVACAAAEALGREPGEPGTLSSAEALASPTARKHIPPFVLSDAEFAALWGHAVEAVTLDMAVSRELFRLRVDKLLMDRACRGSMRGADNAFDAVLSKRAERKPTSQVEAKPYRDDGDATPGTLPLTSIGPSGIGGYAQTEGGGT